MRECAEKEGWIFLYNKIRGIVELFINFFERLNNSEKSKGKKWSKKGGAGFRFICEYGSRLEPKERYNQ